MSIFGVFLIHVFPYSVRMRENMDQKNSEYRHFSRIYFSRLYLFSKILGKIKQRSSFSKVSGYETASYYFWYRFILRNSRKQFLGTFKVSERNNELNLMSQCRHCVPDKCHVIIKLWHNFAKRLWKCYHVTINSPNLTFFAKATFSQRRNTEQI